MQHCSCPDKTEPTSLEAPPRDNAEPSVKVRFCFHPGFQGMLEAKNAFIVNYNI